MPREKDKTAGELLAEQEARRTEAAHPPTAARKYAAEHGVTLAHATQVLAAQERKAKETAEGNAAENDA